MQLLKGARYLDPNIGNRGEYFGSFETLGIVQFRRSKFAIGVN